MQQAGRKSGLASTQREQTATGSGVGVHRVRITGAERSLPFGLLAEVGMPLQPESLPFCDQKVLYAPATLAEARMVPVPAAVVVRART